MPQFTVFLATNDCLTRITQTRSTRYWIEAKDATRACRLAKDCFWENLSDKLQNDTGEHNVEIVCILEGFLFGESFEPNNPTPITAQTLDKLEAMLLDRDTTRIIDKQFTENEGLLLLEGQTRPPWHVHLSTRLKSGWRSTVLQTFSDRAMAIYSYQRARIKINLLAGYSELAQSLTDLMDIMAKPPFPMIDVRQFLLPKKVVVQLRLKEQPEDHQLFEYVKTKEGWYGQRLVGPRSEKTIRYAYWNHILFPFLLASYGLDPEDNAGPESIGYFNSDIVALLTERTVLMPEYEELVSGALDNNEPLLFPLSYPTWFMDRWLGSRQSQRASEYKVLWHHFEQMLRRFLWQVENENNDPNDPYRPLDANGNSSNPPDENSESCWCQRWR